MSLPNGFESSQHLVKAQAHVWKHVSSFINSMSLKCAVQLGIPDIIHKHGKPMKLGDLADAIPINKSKWSCLHRLMRMLVHIEFFVTVENSGKDEQDRYYLTPASLLLLGDKPLSVRPLALSALDPIIVDPWHHLSKWFTTDGDATPFVTTHGMSMFEATGRDERMNRFFNEGMASDARLVINVIIRDCRQVFEGLRSMVDVGGGIGATAEAFVDAFPGLNCTVLDLPHVVVGLKGTKKLSFVGGDMFEAIPHADAIFLKWIMHNWNDEECVKILEKCKGAIPSKENGGKVVIVDMVVMNDENDYDATQTQLHWDVKMMVLTSGRERSEQEWAKLFNQAGFQTYKITPFLGLRSIIEVFP